MKCLHPATDCPDSFPCVPVVYDVVVTVEARIGQSDHIHRLRFPPDEGRPHGLRLVIPLRPLDVNLRILTRQIGVQLTLASILP
jgi:hypothetical protein